MLTAGEENWAEGHIGSMAAKHPALVLIWT